MTKFNVLRFSTLRRVAQPILFVATVLALALVVADMYQQRTRERAPYSPGTERTEPSYYYYIDVRV